ncbi:hypothetical protein OSTOST_03073 [Ostertagia ostertagi]
MIGLQLRFQWPDGSPATYIMGSDEGPPTLGNKSKNLCYHMSPKYNRMRRYDCTRKLKIVANSYGYGVTADSMSSQLYTDMTSPFSRLFGVGRSIVGHEGKIDDVVYTKFATLEN